MALKKSLLPASLRSKTCLAIIFFLFTKQVLNAQNQIDSTKNPLLASLEKNAGVRYITLQPNVVFPDILKGNEEEMMPYIKKFSSNRRDYLIRMYTKGKAYLPKAASILKKHSLPEELKILLPLESAYNGNAVSKAGAVGYWQFMDEVAKEYGLKYVAKMSAAEKKKLLKLKAIKGRKQQKPVVKIKDDRKNFNVATHAAARYLRDRRRNLDDNWLLIVASYNCGVGNVWNAMERSGIANPTFWDIKNLLPAETRAYVMNFITLNVIFNNYDLFIKNKLSFASEKVMVANEMESNMAAATTD